MFERWEYVIELKLVIDYSVIDIILVSFYRLCLCGARKMCHGIVLLVLLPQNANLCALLDYHFMNQMETGFTL